MTAFRAGFITRLTRSARTGAAVALLAATATLSSPPAVLAQGANPFAAAVTVNGTIITNYQLSQRFAFLTLLRAPGVSEESVRDTLTNEALQVQAAQSAGIVISPEELEAGIAEFSGRTNLEPEAFVAIIGQNGIAAETLRDFVQNGLMWRNFVRQRFAAQGQVSEAEVDRALSLASGRGSARILLSEIVLPLTPELAERNTALAARLSQTINSPAAFAAAARRYSAAPTARRGGRLDWVPLGNLPPPVVGQVLTLAPGEVSEPVNLGPFIALFQLRDLEELEAVTPETLAVEYAEVVLTRDRAEAMRDEVDTCDDLYGQDFGDALARQSVPQAQLSQDLSLELAKLDDNEISTLLPAGDGVRFIMLCGRASEFEEGARDQIRAQLRQQRLVTYSSGYLDELRADAVITQPEG